MKDMIIFLFLIALFGFGSFIMAKMGSFLERSFQEDKKEEVDYGRAGQERVEYDKALLESRQKPSWKQWPGETSLKEEEIPLKKEKAGRGRAQAGRAILVSKL